MRLKPGLPVTSYNTPRGRGLASIPNTTGFRADGQPGAGIDYANPLSSMPSAACFWDKAVVMGHPGLDYAPGKIFLGRVDQKPVGLADTRHIVTLAGSGGGKTTCVLIPNLRLYPGSCLVIDPKGDLAAATAKDRAAMGHAVYVLDPWGVSGETTAAYRASLDPLQELAEDPANLIDNAELIADALIIPNEKDPHWTDSARALVRGLILVLALDLDGGGSSLARLPGLIATAAATVAKADEAGGEKSPAGIFDLMAEIDPAAGDAFAIIHHQGAMMRGTSPRERASILSTARTQLAFLESPAMAAAVASSALVLADLKRAPSTVYLCLPASRMATHSRWLRLIINLALASMEREPSKSGALPVLFMLEEFSALGHMRSLERAVAYMRSFNIRIWAVLQDLTQLKRDYKDGWETFLGNAGFIQAFSVTDWTTQEHLSKMLGKTTIQVTNKQEVGTAQAMAGDTGLRREFRTENLLNPDEVGRFFAHDNDDDGRSKGGRMLVKIAGKAPFIVDRVFHTELEL